MPPPSIQNCDNSKKHIFLLLQQINKKIICYIPEKVFEAEKKRIMFQKSHKHRNHMEFVCDL